MKEENLKKLYRETFDEVHTPDNLLGKVKNMKKENIKAVKRVSKRAACAAAALLAAVLVSSNAIAYAATGSTWVEKVKVCIDGYQYSFYVKDMEMDDGKIVYTIIDSPEANHITISDAGTGAELITEDGRVYISAGEGEERTDITDKFKDNVCEGDIDIEGKSYHYVVTENTDTADGYSFEVTEKQN